MMENDSFSSLLEAFQELNQRKRDDPGGLEQAERDRWRSLRREVEQALFQRAPGAAADTRESVRVPVCLHARYWTRDELKDRYISVLGEGGLFVASADPLPLGSILDLEIGLAQRGFSFQVKGEVVWVAEGADPARRGMGIRFVGLSYEQKRTVYSLVDDNMRQRLLERRRFARIDARLQVEFVYADGYFELTTEDVSLGGLFIATEHLLTMGETLRLVLHLPSERPAIKAMAEVVRVVEQPRAGQPVGIGVRFLALKTADRTALQDFLAGHLSGRQAAAADSAPEGGDRRQRPRMERRLPLRFQATDAVGMTFSRDISTGGVFLQTPEPPPLGSRILVTLVHPVTVQALELPGEVVRVTDPDPARPEVVPGVGVAFEPLPEELRRQLEDVLEFYAQLDAFDAADVDPAPPVPPVTGEGEPDDSDETI